MEKHKTAAAGSGKPTSQPGAPKSAPATETPVTTRKDLEQNTYTSERGQQLREGNVRC
jgi:hypothetical protein